MSAKRFAIIGFCALSLLFGGAVRAQSPETITGLKQERAEFGEAELAAQKKQVSVESFQQELDKLLEQKGLWQREIVYAKAKLATANEKWKNATTLGKQEDIEKWRQQVEHWQSQIKVNETELAKADSEIQTTAEALQTVLKQSEENSLILPGESIEVFVAEDETLSGVFQVRRGGYVMMPRIGRVQLAGKDLADAEKTIKEALAQTQIKDATVTVERPQGGVTKEGTVIYLAGSFVKPGAWRVPAGVVPTIVTTILRSGGLKESADLTRVRLLRLVNGQPLVEEINVKAIMNGAGLQSDLTLNAGDIVMVPAYANVIYVTGNVMRPGTIKLLPDDELTAYSAILRAGGFSRFANRKKVYVLRDLGNGAKEKIPINIKDLQAGKGSDRILQSKDIVVVPEKFFSW